MKLAFSTLGCPDWSFEQVMDRAAAMGYDAIELRGVEGEMRADRMRPFLPEHRAQTLQALKERGLALCVFGASAAFHDPAARREAMEDGMAAVALCAECGIPYVRVFGNNVEAADTVQGEVARAAEGIRGLCDGARGTGVTVLLEVHGTFNTASRIAATVEAVNRDNFGILWDVAHSDEADRGDFMPFFETVRPFVRHVHLKDHLRFADGALRLCPFGEGSIPLRRMVFELEKSGYDGYYSLEWEKKWHPDLRAPEEEFPAYTRRMRQWEGELK